MTGLRNIRVHRWLGFADGPQSVKTAGAPVRADHVAMQLQVWEEERRRFAVVASGDVLIAETYPLPGRPWTPLVDAEIMPDPYASGELFHGPAYQMLTELQMNEVGATYWLDLDANGVPEQCAQPGLARRRHPRHSPRRALALVVGDPDRCRRLPGGHPDSDLPPSHADVGPHPLRSPLRRLP